MKKIVFVFLLVSISFFLFSNEKNSFSNIPSFTQFKEDGTPKKSSGLTSEQFEKADKALRIIHPIFAGVTYAGFLTLDGLGIALLSTLFNNPEASYYNSLKTAHLSLSIASMTTFSTLVILGFIKAGLKVKAGYQLKKTHLIASFVGLGFYALELISSMVTLAFFVNDYDNKEWVALSHGIICGLTTLSMSVSLITVFF